MVGEAENGQEAVELCRSLSPDLVPMGIRMPKMDGLEATRTIKIERPATSILIVTAQGSPYYLREAIEAGAVDYMLKDAPRQQMLDIIRRVLSGE